MKFSERLKEMDACSEAVEWVGRRGLVTAWRDCERGDWMLWLAGRVDIDRKLLVLAACDCAETALKYAPKGEDRPRKAIETARAWCEGKATLKEVYEAARAAARTAARTADTARAAANKHHAEIVRKHIPVWVMQRAIQGGMK